MYALFAVGTTYYANRTTKSLQKQADVLTEQVELTKRRVDEVEARTTKQRLLLQARLSDYSRELEFWRNTIRALVQSATSGRADADHLIAQVTSSLKTFGAAPLRQFDAVRVAAAWLNEAEAKAREISRSNGATAHSSGEQRGGTAG